MFSFLRLVAIWAGGLSAAFVLLVGLLHTKLGAPLLAKVGVGCPVRPGTPEEVDRARAFAGALYAGKPVAPARPSLGFTFEKTTLSDVESWASRFNVSCQKINGTETLRSCSDVPAIALGQPEWFGPAEVSMGFRADRTLAVVDAVRSKLAAGQANAITAELVKRLEGELGPPAVRAGDNRPEYFAKGPLQAFKEEWVFGNYGGTIREVRLGNRGISVGEHYISPVP